MLKNHPVIVVSLIIITVLALTGSAAQAFSVQEETSTAPAQAPTTLVVRVYYTSQDDLNSLASRLDVWEVNQKEGYLVAMVTPEEQQELIQAGYRVEVDEKLTQQVNTPRKIDPNQLNGIPGFTCYRTVEETVTSMNNLVTNYPNLVEKFDIGNSWDKATPGGPTGYDLWALKITNQSNHNVKPVFFLMAEIHAREYVTAETAMRFAEYLVSNYGVDPDITWLLDYYEIHIVPLTNPDGRKFAEGGTLWRKNTDNDDGCTTFGSYGTDLNRNSSFKWVGGGSSTQPCNEVYRGPSAASEPETLAIQDYATGIFRDQRGSGDTDPAPANTTGEFITLHSYSPLVLWPWGWTSTAAPNATQLQTLGRKLAYFNNYPPEQSDSLYATNGTTDDWAYGIFGVAAYTFEMGTTFFQDCASFESTIYPTNLSALLYAFKAARLPYMESAGPEALNVTVAPSGATVGQTAQLTAVINDQRYNNSNGAEPTQNIKTAAYYIDTPPWITGAITHTMSAVDGTWNHQKIENVTANIDTTGLGHGRHTVYVRGQDASNNWGVVSAAFLYVIDPAVDPSIQGYVRDGANNAPLSANLTAGSFNATTDPSTGYYSMVVISDTYALTAASTGHGTVTVPNVQAQDYQTVRQDIYLYPICTIFSDNVESGNLGWTADSPWGITTPLSHSPTHSWTDSPGGNYGNNRNISVTSPAFVLSTYSGINLSFWQRYVTEATYDYAYVEYSPNGTTPWTTVATYTGSDTAWKQVNLALPGLDNRPVAKIRFRLYTDPGVTADGWYIDDILLTGGGPACVTSPLAPTAEFTSTSPVNLGTAIQFNDLTVGTPPFTYAWDFGDGVGHSSDSNPAYTYAAAGTYTVTLTLTNTLGNDSASHPVTVNSLGCTDLAGVELTKLSPDIVYQGLPAQFSVDLSPNNATKPYTYTIDYGDLTSNPATLSSADPFQFSYTYEQTGTFTMTFSAWNCAMTIPLSDTLQVTVTENTNVCTDLVGVELTKLSPDIVYQGLPAQFSVDLSPDDATKPYTYTLGYGDLTPPLTDLSSADPFQFSYTYQQTGTFTMTFSAWNCAMTIPVSDTLQVEVEPFIPPMKVFLPMIMTNFAAHTQAPVKTLPVALWAVIPVVGLSIRKFYKRKK